MSAWNGQDGNDVSLWGREQGHETTGGGVDVAASADKEPSAQGKRLGRSSRYDSLANAASTFRQIQPKQPPLFHRHPLPKERRDGDDERRGTAAVGDPPRFRWNEAPKVRITQPKQSVSEDIRRSELAAAIARGLPKRRRGRGRPPRARPDTSGADEPPKKQIRAGTRRQRRRELQAEDLASVLRFLEDEFAVKESLSSEQTWCKPIPHERKVSTVRAFYKEFHDVDTLPIRTCMLCYRKRTKKRVERGDMGPMDVELRRKGQPFAIFMSEVLSRGRDLLGMWGVRSLLEAGCSVARGPASQTYWV